jgi:adenylosuccinate synthase
MQWGDEGKGKVVDWLARDADIVARFQGGANAGHTVSIDGRETILHQIPAGILRAGVICLIGNGVVLDPEELFAEIALLGKIGIAAEERLKISPGVHLLLPYHKILDRAHETVLGAKKLGTTCRGIGPAYTDKVSRRGVRLLDLTNPDVFSARVREEAMAKERELASLGSREIMDAAEIIERLLSMKDRLLAMAADVSAWLCAAESQQKRILLEGAQGTMLDLDHGTYPYVTSSNTTIGGALVGLGIPASFIGKVWGVAKAYTTRVGMGPFPTELTDELGEKLRTRGREFGATTGRPRRCGWFDAAVVRYAVRVNGVQSLVLTKLDVLDSLETIKVSVGYRLGSKVVDSFGGDPEVFLEGTPVYEDFEGWRSVTSSARTYEDLPVAARRYIEGLAELTGCRIECVSIGPSRDALIEMPRSAFSHVR